MVIMMTTSTNKAALKLRVSSRRMEVWNIIADQFGPYLLAQSREILSAHIIMKFTLSSDDLLFSAKKQADLLIVLQQQVEAASAQAVKPGKTGVQPVLAQAIQAGHSSSEKGKTLALYQVTGWAAPRAIVLGIGAGAAVDVREAVEKAVREHGRDCATVAIAFAHNASAQQLSVAMQAAAMAGYVYSHTKPSAKPKLQQMVVSAPNAVECRAAFNQAQAVVAGMALAREWANRPGNYATPTKLGEVAKEIVRQANAGKQKKVFACEVLDRAKVEKLGMGAFLSVAKGTDEPLRFIVLRYQGAAMRDQPIVMVGKGVTFDTGGISLKPGLAMDEMKYDMGGAASVLGLFESLRLLRPAINVVGLIPSCENMPSGRATKPGDVVTSMSGQTIEVLNTDAEGRLILCDALTYAERFKPQAVVDIATLTGNCVLALGDVRCGLFSANDRLAQALQQAADESQDLCWRMPMDDAYGKGLKSNFADVANIGGRTAGSISAAKFLERFTSKYPWAHLDIAGVAWNEGAAKGATGRPVPLLLQFVLNQVQAPVVFDEAAAKTAKTTQVRSRPTAAAKPRAGAVAKMAKPAATKAKPKAAKKA